MIEKKIIFRQRCIHCCIIN